MSARTLIGAANKGDTSLVQKFLAEGEDVNQTKNAGWFPLGAAAEGGHYKTAKTLIQAGARLNMQSKCGWTPVYIATQRKHYRVAYLLLKHGAKPTVPTKGGWNSTLGDSALHVAIRHGNLRMVKILVRAGAKDTPYHSYEGLRGLVDTALSCRKYKIACYLLLHRFHSRRERSDL
jgi:ankyrin repeat protein